MINWPIRARAAIAYLFGPLQDVDVYVEDIHDSVFYTELLKRFAPATVRVARVFPEGSRLAVIAKATSYPKTSRRALFLIDGDFEWVRDEQPPSPNLIYRLDAYCIENLLIHEEAAVQILIEDAVLSHSDAQTALGFQNWLSTIGPPLVELFIRFAVLNSVKPEEATVGLGVGTILTAPKKGALPTLDLNKLASLATLVENKTSAIVGTIVCKQMLERVRTRISSLQNQEYAISGKDFLFPLFEYHLSHCARVKARRSALRVRLARNCNPTQFAGLANALSMRAIGH